MLPIATLALLMVWGSRRPDASPIIHRATQADTAIARIRREYAAVNAILPRCVARRQDVFGMSLEGGEMRFYRCGGEIRKIVATYYGETGQARSEWYLSGERPFFVHRTDLEYDRPFGKVAGRSETRVYLRGGEMLRWMEDGRARGTASPEAREKLGELTAEITELLDRARTGRENES